ncbi:MAG: M28 family peptidase, partial [Cyclobacteriaceae bacterium]
MKNIITLAVMTILLTGSVTAQKTKNQKIVKKIKTSVTVEGLESKLRFLASDELKGRDVGTPEIDIAALYIAESFRSYGLKIPEGMSNYYQPLRLVRNSVADSATFTIGDEVAKNRSDIMFIDGTDGDYEADIVFMNYGLEKDYEGADVNGKIVMVLPGNENTDSPTQYMSISARKRNIARKKGAIGVVELYKSISFPWRLASSMLSRPGLTLDYSEDGDNAVFLAWLSDSQGKWENMVRNESGKAKVTISGVTRKGVRGQNVIGWIEGKNPEKKNEYLVMTAHYDHVGVRAKEDGQDSIYNGARDNAIGVT